VGGVTAAPAAHAPVVVGGTVRDCPTDAVPNPARRTEVVGTVARATPELAAQAVEAADRAFPGWAATAPAERAALLLQVADALEVDLEARSRLLTREHGKVLGDARGDVASGLRTLRYYAGLTEQFAADRVVHDARGRLVERRRPMGVVAVIVPWNYPVVLAMLMLAPALAAGNTAVVKLPDHSPLTVGGVLAELAAALPPGVVNVVAGSGPEVGAVLTGHGLVRKVMFTGSTATGRHIMRAASSNLKSLSLELGGNDPAIVLEGADLGSGVVEELVRGTFTAAGQVCYAPKRLYVHRSHVDAFVEQFCARVDAIVVGDGLHPDVTMGPVNNEQQFRGVRALTDACERSGARVRVLGRLHEDVDESGGWFLRPAVVTGLGHAAPLVVEEQFGPVVPILPFDTEDEVVALANDSEYGLAASVWSQDIDHAFDVAGRIDAGTVFVNVHRVGASDVSMPFGGFKQSGIGRGHGVVALEECSELQVLADRTDMREGAPTKEKS
jgi:aldehyde dehydrogenase